MAAAEVCLEVEALLKTQLPPLSKWQALVKVLEQHGLAYKCQVKATELLVHPLNRAKLGLIAHNVHSKGASLLRGGFDLQMLHSSTCHSSA